MTRHDKRRYRVERSRVKIKYFLKTTSLAIVLLNTNPLMQSKISVLIKLASESLAEFYLFEKLRCHL